ncbi:MAG TPA: class D sortase [Anaerolineales bacterium]|nr:class D sortase [Anaerolineales bacterium]
MARRKGTEDLTIDELRRMLVEKRRAARQDRLTRYRKTGRIVSLAPEAEGTSLEDLRSGSGESLADGGLRAAEPSRRKRVFDRILLAVEVLAILGLGFILFNGMEILRDLNEQVAVVLEQPTLTPTPLIVAAVLPSGHTPPNAPGGAKPNDAEIPEHLRPLVQSLADVTIPTPGPEQASRLQIPAIGIDAPIVQGDTWEQLKRGVGQHIGSSNPGQQGNVVLSAHNDIFGEIFRHLDQLKPGDEVVVHTNRRAHTYVISDWDIVEPTSVEVMAPTDTPTLTLISCYPYLVDNKRIVVTAELQP